MDDEMDDSEPNVDEKAGWEKEVADKTEITNEKIATNEGEAAAQIYGEQGGEIAAHGSRGWISKVMKL